VISHIAAFVIRVLLSANSQGYPAPVSLIVRSTEPSAVLTVNIVSDRAGFGLAVFNGAPGWVKSSGTTGSGSTPTIVTMDTKPGWVRMYVADHEPAIRVAAFNDTTLKDLVAEGRMILAVRDSLGHIKLTKLK
jgi:hypothetical protein